jgi:hypothetical protein
MAIILPTTNTETRKIRSPRIPKTTYINDSFNLDCIPFDTTDIVDEITCEDYN